MSKVIDFLARMGGDVSLRRTDSAGLAIELAAAGVEGELAGAILSADDAALRAQIAPGTFYAIQMDRENDEEQEEKDDDETSARHARSA